MIKTVLYIATSLDGFIARPDGNTDWLTSIPSPQTGDYGYTEFLNSIGTTLMGRKSYNEIIGEGIPLFANNPKETNWKLIETKTFDTGVVNLTYEKL